MRTAALFAMLFACAAGATTYPVGPTRAHATLASLPTLTSGDVVEIDSGTYHEVRRWTVGGVTVRGVGATKPVFDATGLTVDGALPNPRAVFQVEAANVVIENVELVNARNGNNGAGVRVTGTGHDNVVLRGLYIHDNDMGIMSDGADRLLIDACEIASNGTALYDGFSHNFYLGGGGTTIQYSYIHDAANGQNVKSRGHYTALFYNYIADSQDGEVGLVDEAGHTDTANSNAVMIGNVVVAKQRLAQYNHVRFIQFGQDQGLDHPGTLYAYNNTFISDDSRIQFLWTNAASAHLVASNNAFFGSNTLVLSGDITGKNNCVPSSATMPTGLTSSVTFTAAPFVDAPSRDFHLTAMNPCRNAGAAGNTYVDGVGAPQLGIPAAEYVSPLQHVLRGIDGMLDDGAYEFGTVLDGGTGGGSGAGGGSAAGGGGGATGGGSAATGGGSGATGGGGTSGAGGGSAQAGGGSAATGGGSGTGGGGVAPREMCGCAASGAAPLLLALALVLRRRSRSR